MGLLLVAVILVIGLVSRNAVMVYSAGILIAARMLGADEVLDMLGTYGVPVGVVILIIVVLLPLVETQADPLRLFAGLATREGMVAMAIGALATYLGGEGVDLMQTSPEVVVGIVVGTTLGAIFFRGIPTGPLVAAGVVALALRFLH